MNRIVAILFICVFLSSCLKEKETVIPSDVIPYEQMVQILSDVQQAEVLVLFLRTKQQEDIPLPESLYKDIMDKRNISPEDFDKSFKFYSSDTKLMEKLYGDVIEELTKRQAELETK